jgi:hypothetical protein
MEKAGESANQHQSLTDTSTPISCLSEPILCAHRPQDTPGFSVPVPPQDAIPTRCPAPFPPRLRLLLSEAFPHSLRHDGTPQQTRVSHAGSPREPPDSLPNPHRNLAPRLLNQPDPIDPTRHAPIARPIPPLPQKKRKIMLVILFGCVNNQKLLALCLWR